MIRSRICGAGTSRIRGRTIAVVMGIGSLLISTSTIAQNPPTTIIYRVTTTADLIDDNIADGVCHTSANTCSLRAAVIQANHLATVNLVVQISVPAGTFVLTRNTNGNGEENFDLNLTTPLGAAQQIVITGAGADRTIIDGNLTDRLIYVQNGRVAELRTLTLRHGRADDGGAIYNTGLLSISDCVIESNLAINAGDGGGIYNASGSELVVQDTTIRANAAVDGAGLYTAGSAKIRSSTLHGNTSVDGGGIYDTGSLILINSTLSSNTADSDGGGLYSDSDAFLYNASVVGNIADVDHDINGGLGGGVYAEPGARVVMINTMVAGNGVNGGFDDDDCDGSFELYGFNLFGEAVHCSFTGNGGLAYNFMSVDSIGPLRDNGGPTPTHALLPGSEAIDATTAQGCSDQAGGPLLNDQRGAPRVAGARCDVGAYEYGAVIDRIFRDSFEQG